MDLGGSSEAPERGREEPSQPWVGVGAVDGGEGLLTRPRTLTSRDRARGLGWEWGALKAGGQLPGILVAESKGCMAAMGNAKSPPKTAAAAAKRALGARRNSRTHA
jgi:hypothetical protein